MTWLWNILMKYAVLNLPRKVQYWTIVDILYHFLGRWAIVLHRLQLKFRSPPFINWTVIDGGLALQICHRRTQSVWAGEEGIWAPNLVCWCPTLCLLSLGFPKELLLIVPQRWKHLWTRIWVNQLTRKSLNEIRSSVTQRCPFFVLV